MCILLALEGGVGSEYLMIHSRNARDMWMQNEDDASATSDLGDSLEYLENDVT